MRLTPMVLLAACMLAVPDGVSAQDDRKIGLGLGLQQLNVIAEGELGVFNFLAPQVYVPIMLSDGLMFEPGIGLFRTSESESNEFEDYESTSTFIRLSAGLLWVLQPAERGRIYAGPRIGVMRASNTVELDGDQESDSRIDLSLAGVVGGEFFLLPAFSIGGEAGLEYVRIGDDDDQPEGVDSDFSLLSLGTEFRVRWYFD